MIPLLVALVAAVTLTYGMGCTFAAFRCIERTQWAATTSGFLAWFAALVGCAVAEFAGLALGIGVAGALLA